MTEEKFVFGGQPFIYEKNETPWELKLKRSDVASHCSWSNPWYLMRTV